jgi:D-alanine-D-alanine ligase
MKVLVLMGGTSAERAVSLSSGAAVAQALEGAGHAVSRMDTHADGGTDRDLLRRLDETVSQNDPDVIFVALHGQRGEDGRVQGVLDHLGVPYTGSGVRASALCMDKALTKMVLEQVGVPTPDWWLLREPDLEEARSALQHLELPCVVKPNASGSSVGVTILEEASGLGEALNLAFDEDDQVLLERFVPGQEVTVAVVEGEALPAVEIRPVSQPFYDYRAKYTEGQSQYLVPAEVPEATLGGLRDDALTAYEVLGCTGGVRVDFRYDTGVDQYYCLEVNTIPGMTGTSLVPKAAAAVGWSFTDLLERMCRGAMERAGARDVR